MELGLNLKKVGRVRFWQRHSQQGQRCCLVYIATVKKLVPAVVVQWRCVWVLEPMVRGSNPAYPLLSFFFLYSIFFLKKFLSISAGSIALAKVVRLPDQQPLGKFLQSVKGGLLKFCETKLPVQELEPKIGGGRGKIELSP